MDDMKLFVQNMIRQTLEDIEYQKKVDPDDPWMKFLEGKMHGFRLVQEYVDKRKNRDQLH